jgi:hypothetical protein
VLFILDLACVYGWFVLTALALTIATLGILELKIDNLVDDDTAYAAWPKRVRWSVNHGILNFIVKSAFIILEFLFILQLIRKIDVFAISAHCGTELGFSEVPDFPMEFARH